MDIVRFRGGLGNQMFQYAFLKALSSRGRKVMGSLGRYSKCGQTVRFCLPKVFENVAFEIVDEKKFEEINQRWKEIKQDKSRLKDFLELSDKRFFWVETLPGFYDENIFKTKNCTFVGYWQTEKYFYQIREELLKDFQFSFGEEKLASLKKKLLADDCYVSIHIRRGDYLQYQKGYGNICTEQYYKTAVQYMKEKVREPVFIFFSDDIGWVKEHYKLNDAIYIEAGMFKNYQAWYDMCLMSCCSHHIIANSTFSWWGAWLNQSSKKKVIAPKVWHNEYEMADVCPESWIRL